jgi:hypothetical protein
LFAKDVMPEFQGRQAANDAWKAEVMSGRLALEEIDTAAFTDRYGKAMPAQVKTAKTA